MAKKIVILFCLLANRPVWSQECFNFEKIFSDDKSDEEVVEILKQFQGILSKFFYIKEGNNGQEIPSSISWDTARKLARFLEREGLEVSVREDLYSKEQRRISGISIGAALVLGYGVGSYGTSKVKEIFRRWILSRIAMGGAGVMAGLGAITGAFFGVEYIPEGNCDLMLRKSIFQGSIPLSNLTFNDFVSDGLAP